MSGLMWRLRQQPHAFELFQAISILERSEPLRAPVGTSVGFDEAVRLSAQVSEAFAPSDVASVQDSSRPGPPLTLSSPVLSLAGAHGPLPMPYTEMLLERGRMRDRAPFEFLDIFNQRLMGFLYRSRRKHHLALSSAGVGQAPLVRCLDALASLGRAEGVRGPHGEQTWLRHAAVQGAAPRSMVSLLAVVRDRLNIHFSGKQFVGGWHTLAPLDRARLYNPARPPGLQAGLGMGGTLGARAWDQGAGIALDAPPLQTAQFASLLPGGASNALLGWLVARHLQRSLQVELKLQLIGRPVTRLVRTPLAPAAVLAPRLGLSAWLCSPAGARDGPVDYQQPRFLLSPETPERN